MDAAQIAKISSGLSEAKLSTYEQLGFAQKSEELVKAYFALQEISAHFFVPLQMLELSLRNNIHGALSAKFPRSKDAHNRPWFEFIPVSNDSQDQVTKAKKMAGGAHAQEDDIVCSLMFGFWVYMLDHHYRDNKKPNHFWQTEFQTIFPGHNGKKIGTIFDELKGINRSRNRLYHHEPLWKAPTVKCFSDAVSQLQALYKKILDSLSLVNQEKRNLLTIMGFDKNFEACCTAYCTMFTPKKEPVISTHASQEQAVPL
jgi:hypothetical protein